MSSQDDISRPAEPPSPRAQGTWKDGTPKYLTRTGAPIPPEYVGKTWPFVTSTGTQHLDVPPIHNDPFEITDEFLAFQREHGKRLHELHPEYFCHRKRNGVECGGWLNYHNVCGTCLWHADQAARLNMPGVARTSVRGDAETPANYRCEQCRKGFKTRQKMLVHEAAGCGS